MMEPSKRGFCHLKWDHHLQNIGNLFNSLFCTNTLIDVTIACQEGSLEAHKFVLSACSPYFSRILSKNPCQHPVLIMHGICLADMKLLVEFMYKGAVDVPEYKVMELVQTAIKLEIKGFYYSAQKSNNHNMTIGKSESTVGDKNKASKKKSLIKNKTIVDVKKRKLSEDIEGDDEQENDVTTNEVEVKNEEGSLELNPVRRRTRFRGLKRVPVSEVVVHDSSDSDSQTRNSYSKKQSAVHKTHEDGLSSITISDVIGANGDITLTARENTNLSVQNFRDHSESPIDNSPDVESLIPDITISEPFNGDAEKENEEDHIDIQDELIDVEIKQEDIVEPPPPVKKTDSKPFRCEFCNLGFARSSHLLRHRRTHTGERPFQCSKCEKRFARQDKLKIHMRSHEDDFYPTIRKFKMPIPEASVSNEILTTVTDEPKKPTATQSIIDSVNAISKPVVIESHNLLKRRRGRPRTRIIPRIEFKRSRGRPRKTQSLDSSSLNMTHDNNYDITSLPFGDLNYLTSELPIDLNSAGPSYHHPLQVQYGVPVQIPAPGVQLSTNGVQLSTNGVQLSTTGIQLPTPGVQLSPPGVQLSPPGIQISTSGVQMSTSGVQMSTAGIPVPISAVQIQAGVPVPIQTAVQMPTGVPVQIQANPFGQMIVSTPQSEVTSVTTTTEQAVTTPTQTTASTPEVSSSSSSTPSGTPNRATALLDSIRLIGECTISPVN